MTNKEKYPMTLKSWINRHIVATDPNPEPGNPNGPTAEDFAADARAEVSTPKWSQR